MDVFPARCLSTILMRLFEVCWKWFVPFGVVLDTTH